MAFDIGAGLSTMGEAVSKYAGVAALEQQKSAMEEQKIKLADQMAGTRREKQNQFELTRDEAKLQEEYRLKRQAISEDIDTAKKLGLIGGENAAATPGEGSPAKGGDGKPNSNNIGNVREVGKTAFVQPASFEEGVNVAVNNARAYPKAFNNGQPMTLMQIAEHWAPKGDGDNDPKAWAFNAARYSGLDPEKPLDLNDPATAAAFARGAHAAEWGPKALKPVGDYVTALENPPSKGTPSSGGAPAAVATGTPPMPPPIDPYRRTGLSLLPTLKPYGEAMTAADKAANEDAWKRRNAGIEEQKTQTENLQRPVNPDGSINQTIIDAAAAKKVGEERAAQQAKVQYFFPQMPDDQWQKMTPQDRLKMIPQDIRGAIEGLGPGGDVDIDTVGQIRAGNGMTLSKAEVISLAKQVWGKSFDLQLGEARKAFFGDIYKTGTKDGDTRAAVVTALQHADIFAGLVKAQANDDRKAMNEITQKWNAQFGNPTFDSSSALMNFLAPEASKVVKGGGSLNEKEVSDQENMLKTAQMGSWKQSRAILNTWVGAMLARKNEIEDRARSLEIPQEKIDNIWGKGKDGQPSAMQRALTEFAKTIGPEQTATEKTTPTPLPLLKNGKPDVGSFKADTVYDTPSGAAKFIGLSPQGDPQFTRP